MPYNAEFQSIDVGPGYEYSEQNWFAVRRLVHTGKAFNLIHPPFRTLLRKPR